MIEENNLIKNFMRHSNLAEFTAKLELIVQTTLHHGKFIVKNSNPTDFSYAEDLVKRNILNRRKSKYPEGNFYTITEYGNRLIGSIFNNMAIN